MEEHYWIASVLFKIGEKVDGLKTAVVAGEIWEAVHKTVDKAKEHKDELEADGFCVTDIGIANDNMVPPEGWWPDPLAEPEDWPE